MASAQPGAEPVPPHPPRPQPPRSPQTTRPAPGLTGLPPVEHLAAYEAAVPGSAATILSLVEKQADHRRAIEKALLEGQLSIARRGQVFGLIIGVVAIVSGAVVGWSGNQIAGSFIGAGGVVGLVSVFVLGRMKLGEGKT